MIHPVPGAQNLRVLVVDDTRIVCTLVAEMLSDAGFSVFTAANVEEARRTLDSQDISLVLCDFSLGGKTNGVEFLQAVEHQYPNVRPILMSGSYGLDTIHGVRFPVISKPFSREEIVELIRDSLPKDSDGRIGAAGR